ncbi:MAG: N-acetylmuramoyl-L-alanine amidase [Actinophytocola sp.]|uniref:N-acetylmuramoyl-L-alanine amidase n=1 Tax=Actinophytocola sp. TaxID=1872138 RepID=UPI003C759463
MRNTTTRRIATAALVGAVATALFSVPATAERLDTTAAFASAAQEFDVPRDLVVAVGHAESRLAMHAGKPSQDNGFGLMHLVSNPSRHTLEQASAATGASASTLKNDVGANIRGGAAVLRALADAHGLGATDRDRLGAWYPVVAEYGGASLPQTRRLYADVVYDLLASGLSAVAPTGERITVTPRAVTPERGNLAAASTTLAPDYPGAIWNPATSANYASGRTASISTVVIHVTQGSYAGTISWFQNPDAQVSAHYVIRSSDGEVTQMVADADTAWHARSANASSLGIEHEGFVDDPAWFTDAMYRSSAAVTKWLCDTYGLAKTRDVIVGHSEVPGNDHTDPGPNWDWNYYMSLVTA